MSRQQTGAAFALPYICNTGMAMLLNLVVDTGQDIAIHCQTTHIAWFTFRTHSVTHGIQNRQHTQKENQSETVGGITSAHLLML